MSGLAYITEESIGGLCPLVVSAAGAASADLNAQLAGALSLQASLNVTPPTLQASIAALTAFIAQLQAAVNLGLPNVSFNLSACASLIASIQANLNIILSLQALFGAAGIFVYTYDGPGNGLGPALTTELATQWRDATPSANHANALVLGTVTPATWTAMLSFFGGA